MKKKLFVLLVVGTLAGLGYHWSTVEAPPALVEELRADNGPITSSINASGVVRSGEAVVISAVAQGVVAEAAPRVGDRVRQGQVLVQLSDRDAQSELVRQKLEVAEAHESLLAAQRTLKDRQEDMNAGGGSRQAVTDAQNQLRSTRVRYQRASSQLQSRQNTLAQYRMTSPIDGLVTSRNVNVGEFVQAGTRLYSVASDTKREIQVKVDPVEAMSLTVGQEAHVSVDGSGGTPDVERVLRMDPSIRKDGNAEYLPVWVSVGSANGRWKLDQQVDVSFTSEVGMARVRLPLKALVMRDGKNHVWQIQEGRLVSKPVTLGIMGDQFVEITQGLDENAAVVVLEGQELREGDQVRSRGNQSQSGGQAR
ncbi:MAG: efflux RND transporter periplasmic adaptor subunit [Lautropia sp.]|nr:efflux RND transporter periplasmic adaptor subunit [Lautropia sp.]